jgi:hypothetical protein
MTVIVTNSREQLGPLARFLARMGSGFPCVPPTMTANSKRGVRPALRVLRTGAKRTEPAHSTSLLRNPVRSFCAGASSRLDTRLYLGTGSGHFRRPAALGLLLHFVLCGFRFLPKEIRLNGKEHRATFFLVPPEKQTFGTWEPGPLPRLRQVCPKQIRELKTENKTCI